MAKLIVVYDLPDPLGILNADEQQRDDYRNWMAAELEVSTLNAETPGGPDPVFYSVSVVSDEAYQYDNRSIWQRGAG